MSPATIRESLTNVLASRAFCRAGQLRRLLSYVVAATLDGKDNTLKEVVIGVEVFNLPTDFDPKIDPVVRMGMRRLRKRLEQYYESEGAQDVVTIRLEPGSYVPRFAASGRPKQARPSIGVLPFVSQEGSDQGADCGSVREALLSRLSNSVPLRVISVDSAQIIRAVNADPESIGRQLRLNFVLRGACTAENDDSVRVHVELLHTNRAEVIWAGSYAQKLSDEIWTFQNDVVSDLEKHASEADASNAPAPAPKDEGVYRLIVQGRYFLNQSNKESLEKAENCFRRALEREPRLAKAWAGLAVTQILLVLLHVGPAGGGLQAARRSAQNAINLDSSLADANTALGLLAAFGDFNPNVAGQHFRRALQSNPEDNSARIANAMTCLTPLGKLQEAEDQLESVLANDPLNAKALQALATVLYFERRFETAVDVALSALDIVPGSAITSYVLFSAYDRLGREALALRELRRCEELMPFMRALQLPAVFRAIYKGRSKWVRPAVLAAAKLFQSSERAPSAMLAEILIRLGEHERAVTWIERAFRQRALRALYFVVDPAYDPIRSHPRCIRLLKETGNVADEVPEI